MRRLSLIGLLAACSASLPALAGPPVAPHDAVGISIGSDLALDPNFGDGGYTIVNYNDGARLDDEALRAAPAGDGGYWLMGVNGRPTTFDRFAVSKIDADGHIDVAHGIEGKWVVQTGILWIRDAIFAADRFYVAGGRRNGDLNEFAIACIEPDGTPCVEFGNAGNVAIAVGGGWVKRLLYREGALYAIGESNPYSEAGQGNLITVAKLDAMTGALDTAFGGGIASVAPRGGPQSITAVNAAAFAGDGRLLVGGMTAGPLTETKGHVTALDATTGSLDSDFASWGSAYFGPAYISALHVRADGRILVAGNSYSGNEPAVLLALLEPDGTPTTGFGDGSGIGHLAIGHDTNVTDIAERANGDLVVAISSSDLLPNDRYPSTLQSVAQFDANGHGVTSTVSIEFPSGTTPYARAASMLIDARDRIVVAGTCLLDSGIKGADYAQTLVRLVRDGVFSDGFEAPTG